MNKIQQMLELKKEQARKVRDVMKEVGMSDPDKLYETLMKRNLMTDFVESISDMKEIDGFKKGFKTGFLLTLIFVIIVVLVLKAIV